MFLFFRNEVINNTPDCRDYSVDERTHSDRLHNPGKKSIKQKKANTASLID